MQLYEATGVLPPRDLTHLSSEAKGVTAPNVPMVKSGTK